MRGSGSSATTTDGQSDRVREPAEEPTLLRRHLSGKVSGAALRSFWLRWRWQRSLHASTMGKFTNTRAIRSNGGGALYSRK